MKVYRWLIRSITWATGVHQNLIYLYCALLEPCLRDLIRPKDLWKIIFQCLLFFAFQTIFCKQNCRTKFTKNWNTTASGGAHEWNCARVVDYLHCMGKEMAFSWPTTKIICCWRFFPFVGLSKFTLNQLSDFTPLIICFGFGIDTFKYMPYRYSDALAVHYDCIWPGLISN